MKGLVDTSEDVLLSGRFMNIKVALMIITAMTTVEITTFLFIYFNLIVSFQCPIKIYELRTKGTLIVTRI